MVSVTGASIQNNECVWQTRIVGLLAMSIMMAAKTEREREEGEEEKKEREREREEGRREQRKTITSDKNGNICKTLKSSK